jgi:hypothetical protein
VWGAALLTAALLTACGSATRAVSGTGNSSNPPGSVNAVETVVRGLFSALKAQDYSAAC